MKKERAFQSIKIWNKLHAMKTCCVKTFKMIIDGINLKLIKHSDQDCDQNKINSSTKKYLKN